METDARSDTQTKTDSCKEGEGTCRQTHRNRQTRVRKGEETGRRTQSDTQTDRVGHTQTNTVRHTETDRHV